MYIHTHSRHSMEQSLCNYFNISAKELLALLVKAGKVAQTDYYFDGYKFNNVINQFIDSNLPNVLIDQILFFHLSRRLNLVQSSYSYTGRNLYDLLSTKNVMTEFLKKHEVEFVPIDGHLEILYKNRIVSLADAAEEGVPYLRWRLGHNKDRIDFCFNGFSMKDLLYRNSYARELSDVPEFIGRLATFLKRRDIGTDYYENSRYYCFEYCIPLAKVLFDDSESLSNEAKQKYLLNQIFHRLYDYTVKDIRYMFDHNNPVLRLEDSDILDKEYFISTEEITREMLESKKYSY